MADFSLLKFTCELAKLSLPCRCPFLCFPTPLHIGGICHLSIFLPPFWYNPVSISCMSSSSYFSSVPLLNVLFPFLLLSSLSDPLHPSVSRLPPPLPRPSFFFPFSPPPYSVRDKFVEVDLRPVCKHCYERLPDDVKRRLAKRERDSKEKKKKSLIPMCL